MSLNRLSHIDGLRAIAALSVLVQHMFGDMLRSSAAGPGALFSFAGQSIDNIDLGRFGVVLFFLISGFVVPFSIRGDRPLKRFAISRLFRLYPALWVAIAALTALYWSDGNTPSLATITANLTMAPTLFGKAWLSSIYWTLFIELVFYFLAAALFATGFLFDFRAIFAFGLLLVASTVLPILARLYFSANIPVQYIGLHLSFLFCGLLLRLAIMEKVRYAGLAAIGLLCVQFASIAAVSDFSLGRDDGFVITGLQPVLGAYGLAAVVFIAAVSSARPNFAFLSFIGQISYSIYLFHWIVCTLVYRVFPLTGQWSDLLVMSLCVLLAILVSWAVFVVVEKRMINFAKWLTAGSKPLRPEMVI
ncbi:acyltransferase family protein [Phyllobacterium calauticae]|uniref:acyltransferase family protein n=1 Tax=Phyllobacterium calauticae TaxID=2817027 RepID=UPI001CC1150D|nr:acyltransferase [Phyllobacterium calauticae]MBZ3694139.1 acyltransferase [Phyllobacterium calauticae]